MNIEIQENKIIINENIDIRAVLECGQIFSFYEIDVDQFTVISLDKVAVIKYSPHQTVIDTKYPDYFYNFFDLLTDYEDIKNQIIKNCPDFKQFIKRDLRILKQDPIQTIISFIVSANNNIKRIKLILNKICQKCGSYLPEYDCYAFPTIKQLSYLTIQDFKEMGAGYRSEYLYESIKMLSNRDFSVDSLNLLNSKQLKTKLMTLKGVGPKVADCILFFGFSKTDFFPVDTWIRKAYYKYFNNGKKSDSQISDYFVDIFKSLSGYAQQYLYDYMLNFQS